MASEVTLYVVTGHAVLLSERPEAYTAANLPDRMRYRGAVLPDDEPRLAELIADGLVRRVVIRNPNH